jgi:ribosome-associated protein
MANTQARAVEKFSRSYSPSVDSNSKDIALKALEAAVELRSLDPVALYISPHSSVSDYFVIASGTSERHVQGVADNIRENLTKLGATLLRSTGYESGEWIILDYGDVVVHVFYEPSRHYYQLDQLWSEAPALQLEGRLAEEAKKLRTGTLG